MSEDISNTKLHWTVADALLRVSPHSNLAVSRTQITD